MIEKKEYFCWVRADKSLTAPASKAESRPEPKRAPPPSESNEVSPQIFTQCPEISWREHVQLKYPPAPPPLQPDTSSVQTTRRHVLGMQQVATVHLEHAAPSIFPLEIQLKPIFGSKSDAIAWIESDEGADFCETAQAVSLLCFSSVGGP